jgi:hypothetical protein
MSILDFGFGLCLLQKPARSKGERVNAELGQLPHNFVYFRVISWFQIFSLNHGTTLNNTKSVAAEQRNICSHG